MYQTISKQNWRYALTFFALTICLFAIYQTTQLTKNNQPDQTLAYGVEYIEDHSEQHTLSSILTMDNQQWLHKSSSHLSFGMQRKPYWFRFEIAPMDPLNNWLLEIDYPLLDHVNIWFFDGQKLLSEYHTGDKLPFRSRPFDHEQFLFPLPSGMTDNIQVYVQVKTSGALNLPLNIWKEKSYLVHNGEHSITMGLFFGFMAAMGLSNLFFYITTGSKSFLAYSTYVVFLALTLATLHGLGYKYLWPDSIWLQAKSITIFANATLFSAIVFTYFLLEVKHYSQRLAKILRVSAVLFLLNTALGIMLPYTLVLKAFLIMICLTVVALYAMGIWLWTQGHKLARLYTLAWTVLLAGAFLISLENLNVVNTNLSSQYLLMLGATIETILLALTLTMSYNHQKEKILTMQEEAKADLEYKVEERTLELQIALRELAETNNELEKKNTIDPLTGIRNRRYFDKKYLAEIRRSRREQTPFSLAMIDIDHFKHTNDTMGHVIGDECIRMIAERLKQALKRPSDDICRYGGEEFAMLLPNTDRRGAIQVLEMACQQIASQPIITHSGSITLTVSAGVSCAVIGQDIQDLDLLNSADQALYQAKDKGRNQVIYQDIPQSGV